MRDYDSAITSCPDDLAFSPLLEKARLLQECGCADKAREALEAVLAMPSAHWAMGPALGAKLRAELKDIEVWACECDDFVSPSEVVLTERSVDELAEEGVECSILGLVECEDHSGRRRPDAWLRDAMRRDASAVGANAVVQLRLPPRAEEGAIARGLAVWCDDVRGVSTERGPSRTDKRPEWIAFGLFSLLLVGLNVWVWLQGFGDTAFLAWSLLAVSVVGLTALVLSLLDWRAWSGPAPAASRRLANTPRPRDGVSKVIAYGCATAIIDGNWCELLKLADASLRRSPGSVLHRFLKHAARVRSDRDAWVDDALGILTDWSDVDDWDREGVLLSVERLADTHPDAVCVCSLLSDAFRFADRPEEALSAADRAVQMEHANADIHLRRGLTLIGCERWDDAVAAFGVAIELAPKLSEAYFNRAIAYDALGLNDICIDDLTQVIELSPSAVPAYNNRGSAYERAGRHDLAMADYEAAIELGPDAFAAVLNRAQLLLKMGRRDDAIATYRQVLDNPRAYQAIGGFVPGFAAERLVELGALTVPVEQRTPPKRIAVTPLDADALRAIGIEVTILGPVDCRDHTVPRIGWYNPCSVLRDKASKMGGNAVIAAAFAPIEDDSTVDASIRAQGGPTWGLAARVSAPEKLARPAWKKTLTGMAIGAVILLAIWLAYWLSARSLDIAY